MHALIIAATILSAPGDASYIRASDDTVLVTSERQALGAFVRHVFADMDPSQITHAGCFRDRQLGVFAHCKADEEIVASAGDLLDMVIAGEPPEQRRHHKDDAVVDATGLLLLNTFLQDAFGLSLSQVYAFEAWRDPDAPAIIHAKVWALATASPETWWADLQAGRVPITLGRVP